MADKHTRFAIVGSGFAGSLLAWILAKSGYAVTVLERQRHPRFSIGESSTPLADFLIEQICMEFDLPELLPLARWGTWQASYPTIRCGKKRGFSYFQHRPYESFIDSANHPSSLLVAASSDDSTSDTHWLRSDVDSWLASKARSVGAEIVESCAIRSLDRDNLKWRLNAEIDGEVHTFECDFLIDASSNGQVLATYLQLKQLDWQLQTRTEALFGHFESVQPMSDWLQKNQGSVADDPFCCDDAAQHHMLECGWIWMLRFQHGITSVGIVRPTDQWPEQLHADDRGRIWDALISNYPTLRELTQKSVLVQPQVQGRPQLGWTGRMSRLWSSAAGEGWAMLPGTVGFIDPLHSTGIAHGLFGVLTLARILQATSLNTETQWAELQSYSESVVRQIKWIDRLVSLAYAAQEKSFELFTGACALYFLAAIHCERDYAMHRQLPDGFLLCDSNNFQTLANQLNGRLKCLRNAMDNSTDVFDTMVWLRERLKLWNDVGLLEPSRKNRIARSAAAK
ncbi:MAG: tryptophan 7-halogenase [Planctomycetales bacterium]|nr:tryptophan 7-halogenase [Planctomycetales bacterium]